MNDDKLPFLTHLEELRKRLIIVFIAIGAGFGVSYSYAEEILLVLKRPYPGQLVALAPTEAFITILKVSFFTGVLLAIPVILHQIWKFVAPGLYEHEKKHTVAFVVVATLLFFTGAVFCYLAILPQGLKFLQRFAPQAIETNIFRLSDYVAFVTKLLLGFGAVFELPLIMIFLTKIGVVTPESLASNRKYAILIMFIVGAVLTPPDVFTQLMMAGPLYVLYEISILASRITSKPKSEDASTEERNTESEHEGAGTEE
jgi:sec-independent protein translocase protein TatC